MLHARSFFASIVVVLVIVPVARADEPVPLVESYLVAGRLAEGDAALVRHLQQHPHDEQARFGLGVLRFGSAVEHLAQGLYRHGLRDNSRNVPVPMLRMPLPQNPAPVRLSYADARHIVQAALDDLARAEATLAEVRGDVKLPLHFGRIRLDLNGDGALAEDETLWRLYVALNRAAPVDQQKAEQFVIAFDRADVVWLRGYCHLLSFFGETMLAHDTRELFERAAHVFFANVETPYVFLTRGKRVFSWESIDIVDVIAFIHLINLPVAEPARMQTALEHLEAVIRLSRENWKLLLAETDDDREWIPNPRQTGVIPGVRVDQAMVDGWHEFLAEAEAILQGKKLVPFWRGDEPRGVNLRRVFTEPRTFDLVMWVQGTGAAPYLEAGELTQPETWGRFQRLFRGEFLGFAIWFN